MNPGIRRLDVGKQGSNGGRGRQEAMQRHVEEGVEEGHRLQFRARARPDRMLPDDQGEHRGDEHLGHRRDVDRAEFTPRDAPFEHRRHGPGAAGDDFFLVKAGQLREIVRFGHDELDDAGSLGRAQPLPPGVDQLAQQVGAVAVELGDGRFRLPDHGHDIAAHDGLEQLFLVFVIQVQGALGHAGAARDVFQACGGVATLDEQVDGRLQQLLGPRVLTALPARLGVKRAWHASVRQLTV
ncbi:conserved hypothetical protein, partial [Ricinus communis]